MKMLLKVLVLALLLGGGVQAGDRPTVSQVSFSPDNSRVLVLTRWEQDGSGWPQALLQVLDTASGQTLLKVSSRSETGDVTPAGLTERMLRSQADKLRSVELLGRPATTPKLSPAPRPAAPAWSEGLRVGQSKVYPVFLWSRPVPITLRVTASNLSCPNKDMLPTGDRAATFSLDVNGQTIPLPVGAVSPCTTRYALDRVDLSGNRVLLTVRGYGPGFEGPNAMPIFLAATLK